MYGTIELIIFQKKLSKKVIAQNLQIGYNTFLLKLRGLSPFTLDEAVQLKEILQFEGSVEELFAVGAA